MSLDVISVQDLGTHYLFVCRMTESEILNNDETVTYAYYHSNIKPKPVLGATKKWVCKLCGYVYDGEDLPPDFVCPWCGADISFFEQK
jgi:rubrerythrin